MFFRRPFYLILFAILLSTTLTNTGCSRTNDDDDLYVDPNPFPDVPENNNGTRTRSITYVYDRTAVDTTYPAKIDSSVILFHDTIGKINRIRLTHGDFFVYDFSFERNNNLLTAIHCTYWHINPKPKIYQADLELVYNGSGNPSIMKVVAQGLSLTEVDTFIVKSTGNRIDTVIDRALAVGNDADKYAFKYDASGELTQMEHIRTSGIFFVYEDIYKYTPSGSSAAVVLGNEAIFWYFFAQRLNVSSNTSFLIPPLLFHSTKQPSRFVYQKSGYYTGTSNYQAEYYITGRPKKMTANVITQSGAFYAREAYYYSYTD